MLDMKSVSKSYRGQRVLGPLDLHVPQGRTLALIGPSGCGKSTLLRLLIGLIEPETGQVTFGGRDVRGPARLTLRHEYGYVIQSGGLFPHLTAAANVSLLAAHLGWSAQRIQERLDELCALTHLARGHLDQFPSRLSGGQQQRVALMRALMLDPPVILLDEPLGALDPMIRRELQLDLRSIFETLGKTVVLVTHDLSEAAFLAGEIVLMNRGLIVQQGTIEELIHQPASEFVSDFVSAGQSYLAELMQ